MAINDYNRYISFDDNEASAYFNRGLAFYYHAFSFTVPATNESNYNKAILDFNKAIELDSENPKYHKKRGNTYYQK